MSIWEIEREKGRPLNAVEHGQMLDALAQNQPLEPQFGIDPDEDLLEDYAGDACPLLPSERMFGGVK